MDTKEKVLLVSLDLFSKNGFEATSTSDIASKLGITKGALYKHFKNKEDILNTIIHLMEVKDYEHAQEFNVPTKVLKEDEKEYLKTTFYNVIDFSIKQFSFWSEDEFASKFRKMVTIEHYKNSGLNDLYSNYFVLGPYQYVLDIFNTLHINNASALALKLCSTMFYLYSVYDINPKLAKKEFANFIKDFKKEGKENELSKK